MGQAYVSRFVSKDEEEGTAVIRVYQMHPDYGIDPEDFLIDFGAMAVAGFVFSEADPLTSRGHTEPGPSPDSLSIEGQLAELKDLLGDAAPLGQGLDDFSDYFKVVGTKVVRPAWNDGNRDERLREAGLEGDELERAKANLTYPIVAKIAGIAEIRVADLYFYFDALQPDTEWSY